MYEACVHQSASESDLDPKHIIEAGKEGWKVAVKIIPLDCVEVAVLFPVHVFVKRRR